MFENVYFYHKHIRKAIAAFGTIFNGIKIKRTDASGNVVQSIPVPLKYSTKQKALARILAATDLQQDRGKWEMILPQMGFEILQIQYDAERKLPTTQTIRVINPDDSVTQTLVATPYIIGFRLSIYAKNQDDGLQILEQILPYFAPDLNVTVKQPPNNLIKQDLCITLKDTQYQSSYEGDFTERTILIWELTFAMKMYFYGYTERAELIKKVIANIFADETGSEGTQYTGIAADGTEGNIWDNDLWFEGLWADGVYGGNAITLADDPTDYTLIETFENLKNGEVE